MRASTPILTLSACPDFYGDPGTTLYCKYSWSFRSSMTAILIPWDFVAKWITSLTANKGKTSQHGNKQHWCLLLSAVRQDQDLTLIQDHNHHLLSKIWGMRAVTPTNSVPFVTHWAGNTTSTGGVETLTWGAAPRPVWDNDYFELCVMQNCMSNNVGLLYWSEIRWFLHDSFSLLQSAHLQHENGKPLSFSGFCQNKSLCVCVCVCSSMRVWFFVLLISSVSPCGSIECSGNKVQWNPIEKKRSNSLISCLRAAVQLCGVSNKVTVTNNCPHWVCGNVTKSVKQGYQLLKPSAGSPGSPGKHTNAVIVTPAGHVRIKGQQVTSQTCRCMWSQVLV